MIVEHKDFFDEPIFKAFLDTFENTIDSVVITSTSPDEHFLYVNEAFKHKTGYVEADIVGKSPRILQGPLTNRNVIDELKNNLIEGKNFIGQNTNYRKDGTPYIVKWYISALKNAKNEIIAYVSYQKEETQSVWDNKQLEYLGAVVNQVDNLVSVTDLNGVIVYVNLAFTKMTGYTQEFVIGQKINFLRTDKHPQSFYADMWNTILSGESYHGVFINKKQDNSLFFEQKTITPINNKNGDIEFYVSVGQDITEQVHENEEYKKKAYTDSLTGLHNRLKFDEVMQRKYNDFLKTHESFSMIILDIDNFKYVNDTFGHDGGDKVLKELANLLHNNLRKDDFIVRWGGEEFAIIVDNTQVFTMTLAEKIREIIDKNLSIEEHSITISLGVSEMSKGDTIEALFIRVDKALYISKKSGKNKVTSL